MDAAQNVPQKPPETVVICPGSFVPGAPVDPLRNSLKFPTIGSDNRSSQKIFPFKLRSSNML
ncbi:6779_t:CDS:2 [Acaulospora colombiana]|uniref:6779_t:CDS:1 n=1 Tax=Acaulospora colombiana TaxID=27376 RepID=A0ACA9L1W3_9GLOM|nr:6779_t:CDS:2 [Acaulospora colombiana]